MIDGLEAALRRLQRRPARAAQLRPAGRHRGRARLHVARTICRRAEREVLLGAQEVELNPLVLAYLNRLSDLLFILARAANAARRATSRSGSLGARALA